MADIESPWQAWVSALHGLTLREFDSVVQELSSSVATGSRRRQALGALLHLPSKYADSLLPELVEECFSGYSDLDLARLALARATRSPAKSLVADRLASAVDRGDEWEVRRGAEICSFMGLVDTWQRHLPTLRKEKSEALREIARDFAHLG